MIRVGFLLNIDTDWLGGLNYYRNLIRAISETKGDKITPVILTGFRSGGEMPKYFPDVEIVESHALDRLHPYWIFQRLGDRLLKGNLVLNNLLRKSQIDLLSHSCQLGEHSSIPMYGWIPDFQHRRLPEFFSPTEIALRDKDFLKLCKRSNRIIVSSYSAQRDLKYFAPEYAHKSRVLQFVVKVPEPLLTIDVKSIRKRYDFIGPYFFLPNQFWSHKNHMVVVKALGILKKKNKPCVVLATGNTRDYRQPEYFRRLIELVDQEKVKDYFKILGLVDYDLLICLARNAVAVINPSFFEGWSTTVEEAKSIGKRAILSDIDVHREQNPIGGVYFNPHDPEELAERMEEMMLTYSPKDDERLQQEAKQTIQERWHTFAERYYEILSE